MTKLKTAEAIGLALDWAVAGITKAGIISLDLTHLRDVSGRIYAPSTDWSQGGPIIERERIATSPADGAWMAVPDRSKYPDCNAPWFFGPTGLIAAMRCYVASELGNEVEIPDELLS